MSHPTDPARASLPPGYRGLRERTRPGATARLIEAERIDAAGVPQRVALRLQPVAAAGEALAELAVLAALDRPGLARLVDFGVAPGGAIYVARSWVAGDELAAWAKGRTPKELASVAARLCRALDELHQCGFVHGDLKSRNVIVANDAGVALPVLTDFGLAQRRGERSDDLSGTLFHIAPEVLLGAELQPAADLFALGVMLHELTVARRASAREFYGRFPACDYFEASRTKLEDVPHELREIVSELLERDPTRRPSSAAAAGRALARIGEVDDLFRERRVELRWPLQYGRDEWFERWARAAPGGPGAVGLRWLEIPPAESVAAALDACALRVALLNDSRPRRVQRLELGAGIDALASVDALDRWALETARAHAGVELFAALAEATPWRMRALDALAVAANQLPADQQPASLCVVAPCPAPQAQAQWRSSTLPALEHSLVARFLRERLEGDDDALEAWSEALAAGALGAAARMQRLLDELVRRGRIVAGDQRPRLRPGPLEALDIDQRATAWPDAPLARELVAALHVAGRAATLLELAELLACAPEALTRGAGALVEAGLAVWERNGGATLLRSTCIALPQDDAFTLDSWRDLHSRYAARLEREGADALLVLPHRLRAGQLEHTALAARCEELLESGAAELALRLCEQVTAAPRLVEPSIELVTAQALAWCALGDADRAQARLAGADEPARPRDQAALLRVRGQIASTRRDLAAALGFFEGARALDPDDGGLTLLATARVLGDAGRDAELLAMLTRARAADPELAKLGRRVRENLLAREALALFRTGEAVLARERLQQFADEARSAGDGAREAGLRVSLATVERRAGDLGRAREHFERAISLYGQLGHLGGLAQARAQCGGVLRDSGELLRAQPLLEDALALRERLGDRSGATRVRGMLGLLLADRGHVRAAVSELERTAVALRADGRSRAAALLEARAVEVRARCGDFSKLELGASSEIERAAEGDPRILLAQARALALQGEHDLALSRLERTGALAARLGLAPLVREANGIAQQLARRASKDEPQLADGTDLAAEDAVILSALARAPLDLERLREHSADLRARGRDDRAARVLIALAARVDGEQADTDARAADECFAACARGLTPPEQAQLRRALLGIPDPWPEDLIAHERRRSAPEDDEMEVIGLLDINRRLLAQEDLRGLLGAIVEQSLQVSGAQRGFLILEEEGELKVDTALDSRRGDLDAPDVEVSGSVLREALSAMKPVRVSNAIDDPQLAAAPSVIHLELRSILCVPFEVQKGLRGVIYVDHRLREAAFDGRVERMLTLLANQAALAILQVRRLEEIRRLNRELGRQVARKDSDLKAAAAALRRANVSAPGGGLVGDSPAMRDVRRLLERAASANLPVLVSGPSGSGKELAARALHDLSGRRDGPFVGENCAALPPSLIEAELFGARRGAFTGADRDREGLFERAHGGTLFLDEIGELPLDLQAKLLRVLETSEVRRLGDDKSRKVDVRLVAATNRVLAHEVNEKRFRADLYYRLDGLSVVLPSLAERIEDIPALVDHCLRLSAEPGKPPRRIAPAVVARLCRRAWPGNVRELFNEVARLVVMSDGDVSDPELVRAPQTSAAAPAITSDGGVKPLEQLEKEAILRAIEAAGGDKRQAAKLLGISRAKVYQRLKEWGLTGSGDVA